MLFESEVNYQSYNLILFNKELSYYYINTGFLPNVKSAQSILRDTIHSFEVGNFNSPEQFGTYFQLKLLLSLSYEFFNEHNTAYSMYEDNLKAIENGFDFIDDDIKNLFRRLMYIISSDKYLEQEISNYSGFNKFSFYQNKRRIIEKRIQENSAEDCDIIELNDLFNSIKIGMDKLYHVTHYRLLYQYYKRKGEDALATEFYTHAIKMANDYEFKGQIEQLKKIKMILE